MQGSTSSYANKTKLNRPPLAELPRPETETSIVDPEHIKEKLPSHEELLRSKNKVEGMFLNLIFACAKRLHRLTVDMRQMQCAHTKSSELSKHR